MSRVTSVGGMVQPRRPALRVRTSDNTSRKVGRMSIHVPWSLAIISTLLFFMIPTQEYVVPRSMPTQGPSTFLSAIVVSTGFVFCGGQAALKKFSRKQENTAFQNFSHIPRKKEKSGKLQGALANGQPAKTYVRRFSRL